MRRRRLNTKLLLRLGLGMLLAAALGTLLWYWNVNRNAGTLRTLARQAEEDGNLRKAASYLRQYVSFRPKDPEGYVQWATLAADIAQSPIATRKDLIQADSALELAVLKAPDNDELRRRLVDFALGYGRSKDAREHLDVLLDHKPGDPELKTLYAQCLGQEGRYDKAALILYDLIGYDLATKTFDPKQAPGRNHIPAYLTAAGLLLGPLELPEVADQVIDQMVVVNPESHRARLERARYLQRRGNPDEAQREIAEALRLAPEDADVILAASELAIDKQDYEAAHGYLERGTQKYPDNERMYQMLAALEMNEHGDVRKALAQLERGLKILPGSRLLISYRAVLQLTNKDLPAARATVASMKEAGFDADHIGYLQAHILLIEEKWIDASRIFKQLRSSRTLGPDAAQEINLLLGQCYENMGQPDRALEAYRLALRNDARLEAARAGVQRTLAATGRSAAAQNNELPKQLAQLLAQPEAQRDWESLKTHIDEFIKRRGLSPAEQKVLRVHLLLLQGKADEAETALAAARRVFPDEPRIWLASAALTYQRTKDSRQALAQLDEAPAAVAASSAMRLARGALLVLQKPNDLPARLRAIEEGADRLPAPQREEFYLGMATLYSRAAARDQAKRVLRAAEATNKTNLQVRLRLFHLAYDADDQEAMTEEMASLAKVLGTTADSMWRYCEAARLVSLYRNGQKQDSTLQKAQHLLDQVLRDRPEWNYPHRLRASIYVLAGRYDEAIASFERSFELGLADPAGVRQLVQLLSIRGRFEEAQRALDLLAQGRRGAIMPELQAEIRMRTGNLEEGVRLAADAVRRDPNNAAKQLWFGQVLLRAGQPEEAEKALRRAVELEPTLPQAWLVLVSVLVESGQRDDAEEQLRRAERAVSEDRLPMLLAHGCELLGRTDEAETHYLAALAAQPRDLSVLRSLARFYLTPGTSQSDGRKRATTYLNQMLELGRGIKQPSENVAWARRTMAQLIASSGLYPDLLKATRLVEANRIQGRLPAEDQVLLATLLAGRPEAVSRRKAIRLLEELQEQQKLGVGEQVLLAQLYHRAEGGLKAREQMQNVLAREGVSAPLVAIYCQMLLEQGQVDQASRWAARLEKLDSDAEATRQIKVQLLAGQGHKEEAVALATAAIPNEPGTEDVASMTRAIRLLEKIDEPRAAEALLRRYVALEPKAMLGLAELVGRQGDPDEAFEILKQAIETHPVLAVTQVANAILRERRAEFGGKYDEQVAAWLDRAEREGGETVSLLMQRSALCDTRGDHHREELYYRKLLARKDLGQNERALVLNNLAYNLALRNQGAKGGMDLVKEAIAIHGPTGALLDTRAMVSLSLGDYERAISDLNLAISDRPNATRFFHLALAQLASGDRQAAHNSYLKAKERGLNAKEVSKLERKQYDRLLNELGIVPRSATADPS